MPTAVKISSGEMIEYTPSSDVAAGAVVLQGDLIGIALQAIPANTKGALAVQGVFDIAKATGTGTAISAGAIVYWDATNGVATASSGSGANKQIGKAVAAAATTDAKVRVRLSQ